MAPEFSDDQWREMAAKAAAGIEKGELGVEKGQDSLRMVQEVQRAVDQWNPREDPEWGKDVAHRLDLMIEKGMEALPDGPIPVPPKTGYSREHPQVFPDSLESKANRLESAALFMRAAAVMLRTRTTLQQKLDERGEKAE